MEDNNIKKPLDVDSFTIDVDKMMEDARKNGEKLEDNLSYEERAAYVMGLSLEDYQKKIEELAKSLGMTIEDYREKQAELGKKIVEKQEEYIQTGNPIMIYLNPLTGEITDEVHRTNGNRK